MKDQHLIDLCSAYLRTTGIRKDGNKHRAKNDGPVITISRAAGARGTTIAEETVRQLKARPPMPKHRPWTLFNQNLIQHVIKEHGLSERTADYFPEDNPGQIRATIGEIAGLHSGTYTTMRRTAESIRRLAQTGNTVIVGRGGGLLTADIAHSVRVRLVGSIEQRVRYLSNVSGLTRAEAEEEIRRLDHSRKRYIRRLFNQDIENPLIYDLVINTDRYSDAQVAAIIITALEKKME